MYFPPANFKSFTPQLSMNRTPLYHTWASAVMPWISPYPGKQSSGPLGSGMPKESVAGFLAS